MKGTRFWIILISVLLLISCLASAAVLLLNGTGNVAEIYQSGQLIKRINLNTVTTPYNLRISNEQGGYNVISVEKDRICITEASCPDHVCVNTGWISDSIIPIVCLPNELTIQIKGEGTDGLDGTAQ